MAKKKTYIVALSLITIIGVILILSSKMNKGDYILGKEINSNQIPVIFATEIIRHDK